MKEKEAEVLGLETPQGTTMEMVSSGAALVKLENTTQMQVAVQRPRNEDRVLSAALAELERYPSMADEAIYSKPVGKDPNTNAMKYVEGLSIRAAESLANRWANSAYACDVVHEDQGAITIAAIFMDYEGNTRHVVRRRISKFYKKKNSTQIAQYSPDRLDVVVAAGMSKLLREAILRSLPAGLKKEYEYKAYKVLEMQPLEQRQIAIVARFKEVGIKKDALETHAGKKIEQLTAEDLKVYTGLLNAIRDGEISAEEALGIKKEEKSADVVKPGISVAGPGDGTSPDSRTIAEPPSPAPSPAQAPKDAPSATGKKPEKDLQTLRRELAELGQIAVEAGIYSTLGDAIQDFASDEKFKSKCRDVAGMQKDWAIRKAITKASAVLNSIPARAEEVRNDDISS